MHRLKQRSMIPGTRKVILAVVAFTPLFFSCQPEPVEEMEQVVFEKYDTLCAVYPYFDSDMPSVFLTFIKPTKGTEQNRKCSKGDCRVKIQGNMFLKMEDIESVANPYGFVEIDNLNKTNGLEKPIEYTERSIYHRQVVDFKGPAHVKYSETELDSVLNLIFDELRECFVYYIEE